MASLIRQEELLPDEKELASIYFKPFSILIVTNKRVVGRRLIRLGPNRFEGSVMMSDILGANFEPGIPLLTTPSLVLQYRQPTGETVTQTIRFAGFISRLGGMQPEAIYRLIKAHIVVDSDSGALA